MLKSKLGLSFEYTETKVLSQLTVVTDRGKRFLMSQNTARPLKFNEKSKNEPYFFF